MYLHRGVLVKIDAEGAWVEVPTLAVGMSFGPCEMIPTPMIAGDPVMVGQIDEYEEDLVVLGRLQIVPGEEGGGGPGPSGEVLISFATASDVWTIAHNLGEYSVDVLTKDGNGDEIIGDIVHLDANNLEVHWYAPQTGTARVSR